MPCYLLATIGDRDRPASLDPVKEPLLDRVIVEGPCNNSFEEVSRSYNYIHG